MRVWLVTVGEPLPSDGPDERLHRAGMIASALMKQGHEVVWWSSTFDHSRKRHRATHATELQPGGSLRLRLLHGRRYSRNVSLARLANHREIGDQFRDQAMTEDRPDVILASWPTIELAENAVAYGKARDVPVVVDVRDLWPDIFVELAPRWGRGIARRCLSGMYRSATRTFRGATAITGVSPAFVSWGLEHAGRADGPDDRSFPLGYTDEPPSPEAISGAKALWGRLGVGSTPGEFVVGFVGTMGLQKLDMAAVIQSARELSGKGFRFVLCGDGDGLSRFQELAHGLDNVVFPGWVGRAEIWTLLRIASVGLAPYRSSMNYIGNIPNKPIEYLSAGLPVLSSLDGSLEDLIREQGCGVTYLGAASLSSTLLELRDDPERLRALADSAERVYRERFVAESVYQSMVVYLEEIARTGRKSQPGPHSQRTVAS